MTLEEKIAHMQEASMELARSEGNAIIDAHKEALEKVFNDHKEEALKQSETRIKSETISARQQLNKAMSQSQLELKRKQGQIQLELKKQLFEEVDELLSAFMKTPDYTKHLITYINNAAAFANGEDMTIYLNPSDADKQAELEKATGLSLTLSTEDFIGGIRAVIRDRNILIDHSYKTAQNNEYDKCLFLGGNGLA